MILSDDEIESRLSSPENCSNFRVKKYNPLAGQRGQEIPQVVRELIALTSVDSSSKSTAKAFDLPESTVTSASKGLISGIQNERLTELVRERASERSEEAHESALDNLLSTLQLIAPKLIEAEDVRTLSRVARDMSSVVKDLRNSNSGKDSTQRVVINMVSMKRESNFDVIDV